MAKSKLHRTTVSRPNSKSLNTCAKTSNVRRCLTDSTCAHPRRHPQTRLVLQTSRSSCVSTLQSLWTVVDVSNSLGSKLILKRLTQPSADSVASQVSGLLMSSRKFNFLNSGPPAGCESDTRINFLESNEKEADTFCERLNTVLPESDCLFSVDENSEMENVSTRLLQRQDTLILEDDTQDTMSENSFW
ncbi:hypothetical protein BgiMline_005262 [Biomphalaria glabrata]|nr:hypothetical protein BgiMline_003329 [Biomphalaria glabrata]